MISKDDIEAMAYTNAQREYFGIVPNSYGKTMNNYLPTEYQTFIHASRYARWLPDEGRRETWIETVTRFTNFSQIHLKKNLELPLHQQQRSFQKILT